MDTSVPFYPGTDTGTGTGQAPVTFSLAPSNDNSYYLFDTDKPLPVDRPTRSLTYPFNSSVPSQYGLAAAASLFPATESVRAREESPSAFLAPFSVDHFPRMVPSDSRSQRFPLFRRLFPRFYPVKDVPKAEKEIDRCLFTVQKSARFYSTRGASEDFLNRHQCDLLVRRLSVTGNTLAEIKQSPLLDENTVPALEELYQSLSDAEKLITSSIDSTSQWLRAAVEQRDLKETFANLLYSVKWCTSVLQSILVENSKESHIEFEPSLCDCQLSSGDGLALLTAMKEDEGNLKRRLKSIVRHTKNPMEKRFATKLRKINAQSPDLVFLDPDDLDLDGAKIGEGAFGQVKETNLLGSTCALKVIYVDENISENISNGKEMGAIKKLGNHPHIVRHFCYSRTEDELYLIMEKLQMDLEKVLRRKKRNGDGLSVLEAVSLMLQIGEGVKYIHGKGVAHRDLKPGNVLVNLEDPSSKYLSRICSVKITDFGSTKVADRTLSNQTVGTGTTKYMAPEVMKQDGDPKKAKFNLLKADVYSFAIMSAEILNWKYPHSGSPKEIVEGSKAGKRPILLKDCPLRLTTLLIACWAMKSHDRPLFPEICRELRYIKGLLLKGDQQMLQTPFPGPLRPMERVKLQGPWGGQNGIEFIDMATSIRGIRLRYQKSPGLVGLLEVTYEILGQAFDRKYVQDGPNGNENETIEFKPEIEYITQIRGFVNEIDVIETESGPTIKVTIVASLTIQTNLKRYGPFGEEEGTPFTSDEGSRVIGFHGKAGYILGCLGVVTIPDI